MTLAHPSPNTRSAFTLIEALLSVAVFAIVLAAINTVFFGALRLRNKTTEAFETALPLQHALGILQKDFEAIMAPGGKFGGSFTTSIEGMETPPTFSGERVTPYIYTASGSVNELARWSDAQKVAYYLAVPTNSTGMAGGKDLVRQVTRNLLPVTVEESEVQWLMSGLQDMRLLYFDGLAWIETWDSSATTNLPAAVKIQITLAENDVSGAEAPAPIELVVPILVQTSTNATEQSEGGEG